MNQSNNSNSVAINAELLTNFEEFKNLRWSGRKIKDYLARCKIFTGACIAMLKFPEEKLLARFEMKVSLVTSQQTILQVIK